MERSVELAIQSSIVALISKKINPLIKHWTAVEVLGVGCSVVFLSNEWNKSQVNLRITWIGNMVVRGILLSYYLDYISVQDQSLTILNMLGTYFLISNIEQNISGSTQYIFAEKISNQIMGLPGLVFVSLAYSTTKKYKRLQECCALVAVQLVQKWLKYQLRDHYMRFFSTVLILYFTDHVCGMGNEIHNYAVYSVSSDIELNFSNSLMTFIILYTFHKISWDPISKQIFNTCSTHALVNLVITVFDEISFTDPFIASMLGAIVISYGLHLK
jgi:hypothetical protein